MKSDVESLVHIALTDAGYRNPCPLNCEERYHVISCLHAVGCAFTIASVQDTQLNDLISALQNDVEYFPLISSQSLLSDLKHLDWRVFIEEVADMHGNIARDRYRKTMKWVICGLKEAVDSKQHRKIKYLRWGA